MATTPIYALPYPLGTDRVMDGDNVIQALAERVEALLGPSLAVPSGHRNVIRNGDCTVLQRGIGPFTGNTYGIDGWMKSAVAGTCSITAVFPFMGNFGGINGARHGMQAVVAGQANANDLTILTQRIENVQTLAGGKATLSFVAYAASGTPKIGVELEQGFGTGGSPSGATLTAGGAVTLSTTPTRYSVTFTVPSLTGKVLGNNGNDYLALVLWLSAGSDWAARSSNIGNQNATFTITDVQLEAGNTATPFERLSQQAQLSWCQRYFQRFTVPAATALAVGQVVTSSIARFAVALPVRMRASATYSAAGALQLITAGGANTANITLGLAGITPDTAWLEGGGASGLVAGNATQLVGAGAGATVDLSAEL